MVTALVARVLSAGLLGEAVPVAAVVVAVAAVAVALEA